MNGPIRQSPTRAPATAPDGSALSDAELEFRSMLERPKEYAKWAADVRAVWMRSHGGQAVDA